MYVITVGKWLPGHCNTNIDNNESLINVSDTNINIGAESESEKRIRPFLLQNYYFLDPVVNPLLKCFGATSAMTADSYLQKRFATADTYMYIPNILKNEDIDKAATLQKSSFVNCKSKNSVEILLFSNMSLVLLMTLIFKAMLKCPVFKVRIDTCKSCCFQEINTDQDYCI